MTGAASTVDAVRESIRARVATLGPSLKGMRSTALFAVLAGAALWPIAVPVLGGGVAVGVAGGVAGLLGGPGNAFMSRFLERLVRRSKTQSPNDEEELR